jgi:hypothetical protein
MFLIYQMWFQMTAAGYAPEVTRDQLGKQPASPLSDPFRPPPKDSRNTPDPIWYRW